MKVSRSGYYKWIKNKNTLNNRKQSKTTEKSVKSTKKY